MASKLLPQTLLAIPWNHSLQCPLLIKKQLAFSIDFYRRRFSLSNSGGNRMVSRDLCDFFSSDFSTNFKFPVRNSLGVGSLAEEEELTEDSEAGAEAEDESRSPRQPWIKLGDINGGLFSKTSKLDKLLICWYTFTGLIHLIVEGYFAFTPDFYNDTTGFFLADIWKKYSKGDSRYASFDSTVVAVELVTSVVWGPACLLAAYAITTHKSYRHVLQLIISVGQIYGLVIYYITAILEGNHFFTNPLYYYTYYIGANSSWGLIPFLIIIRCWRKVCESEGRYKRDIQ